MTARPSSDMTPSTGRESPLRATLRIPSGARPLFAGYGVLAGLAIFYLIIDPSARSLSQLNIQVNSALTLILITAGQIIVIMTGELDLSVGGVVSLTTCLAATMLQGSLGDGAVVIILVIAAAAGMLNGILVAYLNLPSFIVTLATWSIFDGLAFYVLNQPGGTIPLSYVNALTRNYFGVSVAVYVLVALVMVWLWFRRTRLVSKFRALGSNREGAREAGIDTRRVMVLAFVLSSVLSAAGALYLVSQLGDGDPTVGASYVLFSVAAAVVGGTALVGGRGDLLAAISGGLIITLLGSVVFALNLASFWQIVATGVILLFAAGLGSLVRRRDI